MPYHPNALLERHTEDTPWHLRGQMPSQWSDRGRSPEKCAYKPLRIKHFQGYHREISPSTCWNHDTEKSPVFNHVSDFSVVLFRSGFVLVSERNHVKTHKINGFKPCHVLPNAFLEPQTEDTPRHRRRRSLRSDLTWYDPQRCGLTTPWEQTTFTGYQPQVRMHTRWNHDTEKSVILAAEVFWWRILFLCLTNGRSILYSIRSSKKHYRNTPSRLLVGLPSVWSLP